MTKLILIFMTLFLIVSCGSDGGSSDVSNDGSNDQKAVYYPDCDKKGFNCSFLEFQKYSSKSQDFAKCSRDCKQDTTCLCDCFPITIALTETVYVECGACALNYSAISQDNEALEAFKDVEVCRTEMKKVWDSTNKAENDCSK